MRIIGVAGIRHFNIPVIILSKKHAQHVAFEYLAAELADHSPKWQTSYYGYVAAKKASQSLKVSKKLSKTIQWI